MLDMLYDLSPDEDVADIDGRLLVVVLGDDPVSDEVERRCTRKADRFDSETEFQLALVRGSEFVHLHKGGLELPALLCFVDGVRSRTVEGADDCMDYINEYFRKAKMSL